MTLIPDLKRDLVDAATRLASARRRARLRTAAAGGSAAVLGVVAVALLLPGGGSPAPSERGGAAQPAPSPVACAVGRPPTAAERWNRRDPRRVSRLTTLGCGRLQDGQRFEAVARRFEDGSACVDIYVPARRAALECAAGPPPHATALAVSAFAPSGRRVAARLHVRGLVAGWANGRVGGVELRVGTPDYVWQRVALVRVRTERLVAAAGRKAPFGVFAFIPPGNVDDAYLLARSAGGARLGQAELPRALAGGK